MLVAHVYRVQAGTNVRLGATVGKSCRNFPQTYARFASSSSKLGQLDEMMSNGVDVLSWDSDDTGAVVGRGQVLSLL
jgi:hypothetical protein